MEKRNGIILLEKFAKSFNIKIPDWIYKSFLEGNAEIVCQIGGTLNIALKNDVEIPKDFEEYSNFLNSLLGKKIPYYAFEKILGDLFLPGKEINLKSGRFSPHFGWEKTQIHRSEKNIIIAHSEMYYKENLISNIDKKLVDPLGAIQRFACPHNEYTTTGKISSLRPNSNEFDKELFEKLRKTIIKISKIKGYALEINSKEITLMPIMSIKGGEKIIKRFSEPLEKSDIFTAKYLILNSKEYT